MPKSEFRMNVGEFYGKATIEFESGNRIEVDRAVVELSQSAGSYRSLQGRDSVVATYMDEAPEVVIEVRPLGGKFRMISPSDREMTIEEFYNAHY